MGQIINDIIIAIKHLLSGAELNDNEIAYIVLCAMLIILIIVLFVISFQTLFWTRIGWFFEDLWHWLKRRRILRSLFAPNHLTLANDSCFGEEDLTDEDIHEIMNLIHKGNPPKYEIKRKEESSKVLGRSKRQSRASKQSNFCWLRLRFLVMPKHKQVCLWSFGLTKTFKDL